MCKAFLILVLTFPFVTSFGQNNESANQTILFVCEHGAARSPIATAYFNKIAKERGLKFHAIFRGTDPQDSLTLETKRGLAKDGFEVSKMKPKLVSKSDVEGAFQIITFDCRLNDRDGSPTNISQWNGIPPISDDYNVARDQIVRNVNALITQLLKVTSKKREIK
jgi:arsenate reductase